jgi:hypothetical protein
MSIFLSVLQAAAPPAETAPPAPGEWAWLNIPDAEGPGARFSYETAVRRDGQRLEVRLRYDEAAGRPVETRVALDCIARTTRLLERRPRQSTRRIPHDAAAALVVPNTREAVLLRLLCPTGPRPMPANATAEE